MSVLPVFRHATGTLRRAAALLCLTFSVSLAACSDDGDDGDDVRGTWVFGETVLHITAQTVSVYEDEGDCWSLVVFEIVDVEGDTYTLDSGGFEIDVELERAGANLRLEFLGEEIIYEPSNIDVDDLDVCAGNLGNPNFGSCATLPGIPSAGVTGALSVTDATSNGFYFDAYRLDIPGNMTVAIEMISEEFDTYLYLFNSGGTPIASNDDFHGTNSYIEIALTAGCYIVAASSWAHGDLGSYTLSAAAP